jgi:hypothetical protein
MSKIVTSLLICSLLGLSGCLFIAGGGKQTTVNPTLGQQLQELKDARDKGAISDAEYQKAKARMLEKGS